MNLLQLKYFSKVATLQHITKAANELQIAQPALSKTIQTFENELGVKVFDRKGRNIVLNDYGKIVLKYADNILNSIDAMHSEISDFKNNADRSISISMQAASRWLPELISEFKLLYPTVKITIVQHNETSKNIKCDLCISSSRHPATGENCHVLLKEEILLALPHDHHLTDKKTIRLSDVANEPFISLQKGNSLREITYEYCNMAGFSPKIVLDIDDPATIRGFINLGLGISFIPKITWQGVADSSIDLVRISEPVCTRYINLSWPRSGYLSNYAAAFRDYAIDFFKRFSTSN